MDKLKEIFNTENRTKYFGHLLAFLCLFSITLFAMFLIGKNAIITKDDSKKSAPSNVFEELSLQAKSVMVFDVINNAELFSKNSDEPLPLASLTKVMTGITLESEKNSNTMVKITSEYLAPEGDSGLLVGDTWRKSDLLDYTLLTSSNDGAFALASITTAKTAGGETEFIKKMNNKASEIGMVNSKFFNEHGLDEAVEKGGAYGSARDVAALFEHVLKNNPHLLEATRYKNLTFASAEKVYEANNTNTFIDQIPGIIASKTGYTDLAGGNLAIAYDAGLNRPIIIVVLGSTEEGRFTDTLALVEASLKYINNN